MAQSQRQVVDGERADETDEPLHAGADAEISADEDEEHDADVQRQPERAVERIARVGEDDVEQQVVEDDEKLRQDAEQLEGALARQGR